MVESLRPRRVGLSEAWLASEALVCLMLAALALRMVSFARLAAFASARLSVPWSRRHASAMVGLRVGRAVTAAARRAPWRPRCFERGLAAQVMLRRRGEDARLCYGARNDAERGPAAHVWVKLGDEDIVGGDQAARYALLATFPPEPATPER